MLIYGKCNLVKQDKTEVFNMDRSLSPGSIQCLFDKSNNHYSWKKVTTTVHNIIVGKLWIDQVTLKAAWILHISDQQQINQDILTDEEIFKLMFSTSSLGRSMWWTTGQEIAATSSLHHTATSPEMYQERYKERILCFFYGKAFTVCHVGYYIDTFSTYQQILQFFSMTGLGCFVVTVDTI